MGKPIKTFIVYIDEKDKELAERIKAEADEQGRSETKQILFMLKKYYSVFTK